MSTQSSLSVPFSILSPSENVRLLELPPELLAIIEEQSAASSKSTLASNFHPNSIIQLKSAPTDDTATSTKPKEQYLHLCTASHVWAVRQVSTSNSVYVLAPSTQTISNGDLAAFHSGITAFAQPTSTLELLPSPYLPSDIDATIQRLLPIYPAPPSFDDDDYDDFYPPTSNLSLADLLASLPYPRFAVQEAIRRSFVFETRDLTAFLPSEGLLLKAWQAFTSHASSQRKNIVSLDLETGLSEVTVSMASDEGVLLPAVAVAIARAFMESDTGVAGVEMGTMLGMDVEMEGLRPEGRFKGKELTMWVGGLLVKCADGARMREEDLERRWTDLVPNQWWKWCKAAELGTEYELGGGFVRWSGVVQAQKGAEKVKDVEIPTAPTANATEKRNWHEKFAAQRKR
jgi:sister chromatid cohesion protein DCC1